MPILKSWGPALGTVIHSFIGSPLRTRSPAKRRLLDWRRLRRGIAGELPRPAPVGLEQHCIRIAREARRPEATVTNRPCPTVDASDHVPIKVEQDVPPDQ
jgi:hypothetical protein